MARLARAVSPGHSHYVTQQANGRARTFFEDGDYALHPELLGARSRGAGLEVLAWVLMPNPVHRILTPSDPDGLRRALTPVPYRYAGHVHARLKRTGHFWQGRFRCVAMEEEHLAPRCATSRCAARSHNVEDWRWSSVHALFDVRQDGVTTIAPVPARCPDFCAWIAGDDHEECLCGCGAEKR